MNYTVEWLDEAEADLADIWLRAPDQQAVSDAANQIDRHLERHPLSIGEDIKEGLRKLTVHPLMVFYEVDDVKRYVTVSKVLRSA